MRTKLFLFLALFLLIPAVSFSADQNTLVVAPLKYEEKLNLGDVKEGYIDVVNPTDLTENIVVETASLKTTSAIGQLEFYKDTGKDSFEKFVTFPEQSFTLGPQEGRKVKFRIGVPISTMPGGYFGAIFFRIVPKSQDSQGATAITSGRVGTLFLLDIGQGDVRLGKLSDFRVASSIFSDKTEVELEQENLAKYNSDPRGLMIKPTGEIIIYNFFGKEIAKKKIENVYVLPETKKLIKEQFDKPLFFGIYKAEARISNYPGEPVQTKSDRFVKISPYFILLVVLIFGFVAVFLSFFRNKLPRLKKIQKKKK